MKPLGFKAQREANPPQVHLERLHEDWMSQTYSGVLPQAIKPIEAGKPIVTRWVTGRIGTCSFVSVLSWFSPTGPGASPALHLCTLTKASLRSAAWAMFRGLVTYSPRMRMVCLIRQSRSAWYCTWGSR